MRKILFLFLVLSSVIVQGQLHYNPAQAPGMSFVINKPLGIAGSFPADFRSAKADTINFLYRPFNGTSEVLSYFNVPSFRYGWFPIIVNVGGSLQSNGTFIGGTIQAYWFLQGTADGNLVRIFTDSVGVAGALLAANNLSDLMSLPVALTNLGLNNVNNTSDATKNAATATLTNKTIDANNNTFLHIPNSALTNTTIGLTLNNSGSVPNVSVTPASLGGAITLSIPFASGSASGFLNNTNFTYFTNKIDSVHVSNDSIYDCIAGACTFRGFITSGLGGGITSLNGLNAATQFFATGTAGSDFNIVSTTATHTFNFPNASASNRGLLTNADWATFNAKQNTITPSNTIGQYWNGFEQFVGLNTDSITEGTTHLFFTNTRARAAISLTTSGSSGAATYNNSTGVLNIPNYAGGGGGSTLSNNGSGFRLVEPLTAGNYPIQTLFGSLIIIDSTTHSGSLTFTADTTSGGQKLATQGFVGRQGFLTGVSTNNSLLGNGTASNLLKIDSGQLGRQLGIDTLTLDTMGVVNYDTLYTNPMTTAYYTAVGTITPSVSGNVFVLGANATNDYSSYITPTPVLASTSKLPSWNHYAYIKLTSAPSATTYGVGLMKVNHNDAVYIDLTTSGTAGKVYLVQSGTVLVTSSSALSFSQNDVFKIEQWYQNDTIFGRVTDVTTGAPPILLSYGFAFTYAETIAPQTTGGYSILQKGGTYQVLSDRIASNTPRNAPIAVVGTSKTAGFYAGVLDSTFVYLLNSKYTVSTNQGNAGDVTAFVVSRIQSILSTQPKLVVLEIGCNDIRGAVSPALWQAAYKAIVDSLEHSGIKVFHICPWESSLNLSSLDSFIQANYPTRYIRGVYTSLQACGAPCLAPDGIHPNGRGHDSIYVNIARSNLLDINNYRLSVNYLDAIHMANPTDTTTNIVGWQHGKLVKSGGDYFGVVLKGGNPATANMSIGTLTNFDVPLIRNGLPVVTIKDYPKQLHFYSKTGAEICVLAADSIENLGLGQQANAALTSAIGLTSVGYTAGYQTTSGGSDAFFGNLAGAQNITGSNNTYIGSGAGYSAKGGNNTFIGCQTGYQVANTTTGNVYLGYQAGTNETASSKLYISNDNTHNLIYGDFFYKQVIIGGNAAAPTIITGITLAGLSATNAQITAAYSTTVMTNFTTSSAGSLGLTGLTGMSIPTSALPNSGASTDSLICGTTVSGIYTFKKIAQSALGGVTNLGQTQNATTYTITSSTGSSATLQTATTSLAGLLDTARAKFIDSLKGGTKTFTLFAGNGTRAAGGDSIYWGGSLNQNTTLATAGFNLLITGLPNKTPISTDSMVIEDNTGKLFKALIPSGGGNTIYSGDGTLAGNRSLSGAGNSLSLGTSGSKLSTLSVNTTGGTAISGGAYSSSQGSELLMTASTINNAITAASGTVSNFSGYMFSAPTITSTNTGISYNNSATVRIDNSPTFSTNSTGTGFAYALDVAAGISHFGVGSSNFSATFDGTVVINGGFSSNQSGLNIGPSSTSQAAVNFSIGVDPTAGSVPTTAGNMWYNGTNLYFVGPSGKTDLLLGVKNYTHTIFTPLTGGTVNLVVRQYNIVNPASALATLTVNLPSSPNNNDVVYIKYTQTVSAVTYGNGTVVAPITAPVAGGLIVLTYDATSTSWY